MVRYKGIIIGFFGFLLLVVITASLLKFKMYSLPNIFVHLLPFIIGGFIAGFIIRDKGWLWGLVISIIGIIFLLGVRITIAFYNTGSLEKAINFIIDGYYETLEIFCKHNPSCKIVFFLKEIYMFFSLASYKWNN